MIKRRIILFIIIISLQSMIKCNAQNLIPNPSFEIHFGCGPMMSDATPWYDPNGYSSDYLNACGPFGYTVPNNNYGYQIAHSGVAYAFFATYINYSSPNPREYIATSLTEPLIENKKYCLEFYVSLADKEQYAIDKICAYFSADSINMPGVPLLYFVPQVCNPLGNIITDTANWVLISGSFIAQGGERFVTFGCFLPDDSINYFDVGGTSLYEASYYIDDVSVYLCDTVPPDEPTNSLTVYNAFTPNADGVNDIFHIKGNNIKELHAKIINRWGQVLYKWDDVLGGWDGKYNNIDVGAGAYFWVVTVVYEGGSIEERKGSLELIR